MTMTAKEILEKLAAHPDTSAELHRLAHLRSDKDQGAEALHHTLGRMNGQALPHYVGESDFVVGDDSIPNPPTGLVNTPSLYFRYDGTAAVRVHFSWTNPADNTDGSAFTDFDYFETQWRFNGDTAWTGTIQTDASEVFYDNFNPGDNIDLRVRAVDVSNNKSDWAEDLFNVLDVDSTSPGTPSTPTLDNTTFFGMIRVIWDGLDDLGNGMPADLDRVEVHVSTVTGFTPDETTLRDTIYAAGVVDVFGDVGTALYIKLVAYDNSGNFSDPSVEVSSTPLGVDTDDLLDDIISNAKLQLDAVDTANIVDLAISTAKLDDLSVATAKLQDSAVQTAKLDNLAVEESKLADLAVAVTKIQDGAVQTTKIDNLAVTNAKIDNLAVSTAKIQLLAVTTGLIDNLAVTNAKIDNLAVDTAKIQLLAVTTALIDNLAVTTAKIDNLAVTNAKIDNLAVSTAKIQLLAVTTALIDNLAVTNAKIDNLAVDTAKIADLTVTDAKIYDLTVTKLTAGTLSADVILSGRFKTDVSPNARTELDDTGLRVYDSLNVEVAYLKVVAGVPALYVSGGTIEGGTVTGSTITGGTVRTAASGKRVQLTTTLNDYVQFYTGDASETASGYGYVKVDVSSAASSRAGRIFIVAPKLNSDGTAMINVTGPSADGTIEPTITLQASNNAATTGRINLTAPAGITLAGGGLVAIDSGTSVSVTDLTGTVQVGTTGGTNIGIGTTIIQARSGGSGSTLSVNPGGGDVALSAASRIGTDAVKAYGQTVCVGPSAINRPYEVNGDSASYTTNASGQVNINHGLGGTPTSVVAVSGNGGNSRWMAIDTLGATTFRVTVYNSAGTVNSTSVSIKWIAFR